MRYENTDKLNRQAFWFVLLHTVIILSFSILG